MPPNVLLSRSVFWIAWTSARGVDWVDGCGWCFGLDLGDSLKAWDVGGRLGGDDSGLV